MLRFLTTWCTWCACQASDGGLAIGVHAKLMAEAATQHHVRRNVRVTDEVAAAFVVQYIVTTDH